MALTDLGEIQSKFPSGAAVRLKGAAPDHPRITVSQVRGGMVQVVWFDNDKHLIRDAFLPDMIEVR